MLSVEKAAGAIGAYVSGTNVADIAESDALFGEVKNALFDHGVLFFRAQNVEATDLRAFAQRFGTVEGHPAYPVVDGTLDVQVLESTAQAPSKIECWHTDMTFRAAPPTYTLLHGQIIPPYGGDTLWSSTAAAYDALSEPMKRLLGELTAVHDFSFGFQESLAEAGGYERLKDVIAANPPVEHPVVLTHPESGKQVIYVNALFTVRIKELPAAESRTILDFLFAHVATEEFTVRLNWAPKTLVIWDNRLTQHKPVNDFFPQHRKMHRVTVT